jgi:hypothetical protein
MSFTSSRDHLNPNDPLYYAPPRLRRGPDFPAAEAPETTADRSRPLAAAPLFDTLLEEAVAKSLAHPQGTERAAEPAAAFAFEDDDQRHGLFSVAARFTAAIAAAAVVAFIFVVVVPMSQKSEPAKIAASEYRALLASAMTAQAAATREEPQVLLQKFVQWQQRDSR